MKHTPPPVTPTEMKRAIKSVRAALGEYRAARRRALAAIRAYKADKTGRNVLAQEDALGDAYWARQNWLKAVRQLAACESRGVQKYAHVSPNAAARLVRGHSGR